MELSEAVVKRIKNLLDKNDMTIYTLSMNGGIPYSTLSDFMNRKTKTIRLETLLHVCEGFDITLEKFFGDRIFKDVEAE